MYMDVRSTFTKLIPLYNITNIYILYIYIILWVILLVVDISSENDMLLCCKTFHRGLSKRHLDILQLDEFIDMVVYFKNGFSSVAGDRFSKNTLCVEGSVVMKYQ